MPGTERRRRQRVAARAALVLAVCAGLVGAADVAQAAKAKSTQTEAVWVKFDPEARIVVAKVKKPGKGAKPPRHLQLKKGKEATFKVKPTGSVLTRTTVAIRGRKAELEDIPEGKTVNIYWVPDPDDDQARFARKIDVILSEQELDEMYGVEE
jgi:hypothetical protein